MVARLGILGSSAGTNMAALADACETGTLAGEVVLVLSDVVDSGILKQAKSRGLPAQFISPGNYRSKLDEAAERSFIEALQAARVEWVLLAGFMRIIKSEFLRAFPERIVNIHPSLLPSFPGRNAPAQALESGVKVTGTTVHMVDQGIDTGAIIAQESVPVQDDDTPETLQARIQTIEHQLYPRAVHALVTGRIQVTGRQTINPSRGSKA